MSEATKRPTRGFTLVELAVVMVILGILMSFILVAAMDGIRAPGALDPVLLDQARHGDVRPDRGAAEHVGRADPGITRHRAYLSSPGRPVRRGSPADPGDRVYDMMRPSSPMSSSSSPHGSGGTYAANSYPLNFAAESVSQRREGTAATSAAPRCHAAAARASSARRTLRRRASTRTWAISPRDTITSTTTRRIDRRVRRGGPCDQPDRS